MKTIEQKCKQITQFREKRKMKISAQIKKNKIGRLDCMMGDPGVPGPVAGEELRQDDEAHDDPGDEEVDEEHPAEEEEVGGDHAGEEGEGENVEGIFY